MNDIQISNILAKDILNGKSKYIKDGIVTFDCITFGFDKERPIIHFHHNRNLLASMPIQSWIPGTSVMFRLTEGTMKMTISSV